MQHSLGDPSIEPPTDPTLRINSRLDADQEETADQHLNALVERAWNDLPYQMMLITANQPRNNKPFYWRDLILHLNDAQLHLVDIELPGKSARYSVTYQNIYEESGENFTISAFLEAGELLWLAPSICGSVGVTTQQLAAGLLTGLVTFERRTSDRSAQSKGHSNSFPSTR